MPEMNHAVLVNVTARQRET